MSNVTGFLDPDSVSEVENQSTGTVEPAFRDINVNTTEITTYLNHTEAGPPGGDSGFGLSTEVTIAIAVGSAVIVIIIVIVVVLLVRKRHKKRTKAWVDNLTLSYIADSNIDLTKDNFDETISLDNDNFLNSLDQNISMWTPNTNTNSNTRQYTYSYF